MTPMIACMRRGDGVKHCGRTMGRTAAGLQSCKASWLKIKKSCTSQKVKKAINKKAIVTPVQDGFTIGGFKS